MSLTAASDLDYNSVAFSDIFTGVFTEKKDALSSGLLMGVPAGALFNIDGDFLGVRQWDTLDYTGTSQVTATSSAPTAGANGTLLSKLPFLFQEQAWGTGALAMVSAAVDPNAEMARQLGTWAANVVNYLGAKATIGAFATALASTHSTSTNSGTPFSLESAIDTKRLLGDNQTDLNICVTHGYVAADMLKNGIFTALAGSNGASELFTAGAVSIALGATVYQSDLYCPIDANNDYPCYFGAPGAILFHTRSIPISSQSFSKVFNIGNPDDVTLQVEISRTQASGGADVLTARLNCAVGVRGTEWQSTTNPAISSLATGSNWAKTSGIADKNIKIVCMNTGVSA